MFIKSEFSLGDQLESKLANNDQQSLIGKAISNIPLVGILIACGGIVLAMISVIAVSTWSAIGLSTPFALPSAKHVAEYGIAAAVVVGMAPCLIWVVICVIDTIIHDDGDDW